MWVETAGIADGVADSFGIWGVDSELRINSSKRELALCSIFGNWNLLHQNLLYASMLTIHSSKVLRWWIRSGSHLYSTSYSCRLKSWTSLLVKLVEVTELLLIWSLYKLPAQNTGSLFQSHCFTMCRLSVWQARGNNITVALVSLCSPIIMFQVSCAYLLICLLCLIAILDK